MAGRPPSTVSPTGTKPVRSKDGSRRQVVDGRSGQQFGEAKLGDGDLTDLLDRALGHALAGRLLGDPESELCRAFGDVVQVDPPDHGAVGVH